MREVSLGFFQFFNNPLGMSVSRINDNASAPASTKARMRSKVSFVTPTPAATRRRPLLSLHAIGLSFALVISL